MLYNVTTDMNKDLIAEGLRLYRELTLDSCGDIDMLDLYDRTRSELTDKERDDAYYARVQNIIDDVLAGKPMSSSAWWSIYWMLNDAIDQFDISHGEVGLLRSDDEYDDAMMMCWVIKMEVSERVVTNHQMVRMLADMLLGRFGADVGNLKLLRGVNAKTSVRSYIEDLGLDLADYTVVTAWAMAILGTRDVNDPRVEDLSMKLSDIF